MEPNYLNTPKNKNLPDFYEKHFQNNEINGNCSGNTREEFWNYGPYRENPYWAYRSPQWIPDRPYWGRRW